MEIGLAYRLDDSTPCWMGGMNGYEFGVIRAAVETFKPKGRVLEIGSRIIQGQNHNAIRMLFPDMEYVGVDIEAGPGVDRLANVEDLPFEDSSFDVVIAFNVFEHTQAFWKGAEEAIRVAKPTGMVLFATPFYFHIHNYPGDYWRVSPQGMHRLLLACPTRIVGTQGSKTRPMHVWGIGFIEANSVQAEQWEQFRNLLSAYAVEPVPWRIRWLYPIGRLLCGRRPFEPWLDLNRGEAELVEANQSQSKRSAA